MARRGSNMSTEIYKPANYQHSASVGLFNQSCSISTAMKFLVFDCGGRGVWPVFPAVQRVWAQVRPVCQRRQRAGAVCRVSLMQEGGRGSPRLLLHWLPGCRPLRLQHRVGPLHPGPGSPLQLLWQA